MVSTGYHDTGEEWAQKHAYRQDTINREASVDVLLFDDSTNALTDSSDVGDITTEPTSGNYARESLSLDGNDLSLDVTGGNVRIQGGVSFDVTDTTATIDAYAIVVNFQSDVVNSEGGANDHLLFSAILDEGEADLTRKTRIDIQVNGVLD